MTRKSTTWSLAAAALLTVIIWRLPFGGFLLYPFTILATWFHETGHGLAALLLGGHFHRLQLFGSGSGFASYSGPLLFGNLGSALVAAAGPLGPALAGSLLILCGQRAPRARNGLLALAALMALTVLLWVRTPFGVAAVLLLAAGLLWVARRGAPGLQVWTVQLLGVQACISVFLQVDYLFTRVVVVGGKLALSDTGQMAAALFPPHWFWGALLTALTILLPFLSLRRVLARSDRG
jgi:hypothetical protein